MRQFGTVYEKGNPKEHHGAQVMEENSQPQLQGRWAEADSNSPGYRPQAALMLDWGTHLIHAHHLAAQLKNGFYL